MFFRDWKFRLTRFTKVKNFHYFIEVGKGYSSAYIKLHRSVYFKGAGMNLRYFGLNPPVIDMFWPETISSVIYTVVCLDLV